MSSNNPFAPKESRSPDDRAIFDPEDAQAMHEYGLISPPSSVGIVRVSKRRLRDSSSEDSTVASTLKPFSSPPPSLSPASPSSQHAETEMIEVPFVLNSKAFFVWLGFTNSQANDLFANWTASNSISPHHSRSVLDIAKRYIRNFPSDAADADDDWVGTMNQMGIAQELQDAIMTPQYRTVRLSQTLKYWLNDTFDMRQRALDDITSKSKGRQAGRQKKKSKTGKGKQLEDIESLSLGQGRPDDATWSADPELLSDHVLLWKGLDVERTNGLLDNNGKLADLQTITSLPPSDFSGVTSMWYFSNSKDIAEVYAGYALERVDKSAGNVCLVSMQVPQRTIEALCKQEIYFPSSEWKKVVHTSRRHRAVPEELADLDRVDYIVGHICGSTNKAIVKLPSWKDVGPEHVMRVPNSTTMAQQQVFTVHSRFKLQEGCKDTVHLHKSKHSK